MTEMSDLLDTLMLAAREIGISNMAMAAAMQVASIEVAKLEGVSDEALERGFAAALKEAEMVAAQALRRRKFPH
jgi:hypothetical protein